MRTSPAPRVAYGILPGETAGVPNWIGGPSDLSRWMIINLQRQGGYITGSYANEMACFTSSIGGACTYLFWNAMKGMWDSQKADVPISPQATQTMAQVRNSTQFVSNACSVGGFYAASAIAGALGGAAAGGESAAAAGSVYRASAAYWPAAISYLYRQASLGFVGIIRGYNKARDVVQDSCKRLQ
jgi:hypothetical protein